MQKHLVGLRGFFHRGGQATSNRLVFGGWCTLAWCATLGSGRRLLRGRSFGRILGGFGCFGFLAGLGFRGRSIDVDVIVVGSLTTAAFLGRSNGWGDRQSYVGSIYVGVAFAMGVGFLGLGGSTLFLWGRRFVIGVADATLLGGNCV